MVPLVVLAACGAPQGGENPPPPTARDATLPGTAAVRVEPWTEGRWIVLAETLQAGVKNAPGTHAQVFSDAFLSLRELPSLPAP